MPNSYLKDKSLFVFGHVDSAKAPKPTIDEDGDGEGGADKPTIAATQTTTLQPPMARTQAAGGAAAHRQPLAEPGKFYFLDRLVLL